MIKIIFVFLLAFVSGCSSSPHDYIEYLSQKGVTQLSPSTFNHCRGYGCRIVDSNLSLDNQDWEEIKNLFTPQAQSASEEREKIAHAIGRFESIIGPLTGTENDIKGTYHRLGDDQHDCVDESINTTIYLSMLEQSDLIRFHNIGTPSSRLPLIARGLGPHQSAVIIEKDTGDRFAVDSWFHNNGHKAEIVSMNKWFFGWRP